MKALLLVLAVALASSSDKAACHSECYQCRIRCNHIRYSRIANEQGPAFSGIENIDACVQTCLELKRACCRSCGAGPGPRTTCSCT